MSTNRQVRLKSRPSGLPSVDNFDAVAAAMHPLGGGGVLRRKLYRSLDP
jgi:NADPH-dependent curcumin reductase CurA